MTIEAEDSVGSDILTERRDGILIVTMNRPRERNPLGPDFVSNFIGILDQAELDESISAIVVTGAGSVFCAGGEIGKLMDHRGIDGEKQFRYSRDFSKVVQRIRELDLPVIAAVNGAAVGGGAGLAMACDIAIAAEEASYYFPFGRIGAGACDMGVAYLLPKIVGTVKAKYWILTGASVKAEEGRAAGLFVDVVPRDRLMATAMAVAMKVKAASPRRAASASKLSINRGEDGDFQTCLAYEAYVQSYLFKTDEHRLLVKKFMESSKEKK